MLQETMRKRGGGPVRNRRRSARATRRSGGRALAIGFALVLAGCATVDPRADYRSVQDSIAQRTGAADTYDPQTEDAVAQRVQELLQDGLSLEEAVQVAILNNRGFQALFQEIGASRADVVQSQLLSNPSLSLLFKFPEGGGRSRMEFGIAQELVDLWQIPVRRKIAEAELQQTISKVVQRAVELAGEVRAKYYQVLALDMADAVTRENLTLAEKSLAFVQAQQKAGAVGQLDVNLAKEAVLDVRLELIGLGKQRRSASIDLARVLGLMEAQRTWRLSDTLPAATQLPALEQAVATARTERMDVRITEGELAQAENELIQAHLQVFPSVSVGLGGERTERRPLGGRKVFADTARESIASGALTAPGIQSKAERDLERRGIVDLLMGPTLDITLPVWDQNQAQIAKTRFLVEQKRKELEDVLQAVRHEVETAWTSADQSAVLVRFFQQEAMPVAEQTAEGGRHVYEKGEESILVLLESQQRLVKRRRACIDALSEYAAALVDLERAIGTRLNSVPASQPAGQRVAGEAPGPPAP